MSAQWDFAAATLEPEATMPRYMAEFQCLGGACPETCCSGWSVTIDRATYVRYQAVTADDLRRLLRLHVRPEGDGATDRAFAVIAADETGYCGLLDAGGLCRVQGELGADHLSDVCDQFPREYRLSGDRLTMHGTLGCPEVARRVLADGEALREVVRPVDTGRRLKVSERRRRRAIGTGSESDIADPELDPVQACAESIAAAARELLARPHLEVRPTWEFLAWMLRGAVEAATAAVDKRAAVQAVQAALQAAMAPGAAEAVVRARGVESADVELGVLRFANKTMREIAARRSPLASARTLALAWSGLGYEVDDVVGSVARLRAARETWLKPLLQQHPHLLRNWMLSNLALHGFPDTRMHALTLHATGFQLRLMLFDTLLVGMAAHRREALALNDAVAVAHGLARHIEHERAYANTALMGGTTVAPVPERAPGAAS